MSTPEAPMAPKDATTKDVDGVDANAGKTKPSDGAVPEGEVEAPVIPPITPFDPDTTEDEIPGRFVRGMQGDMVEARRRWQVTKRWRIDEKIDGILEEPQPYFEFIKEWYPTYYHKRAKNGSFVYIETPGKADINRFWNNGVTEEHLLRHYLFLTEFLWRVADPREDGMLISIFDLAGCSFGELAGNTLKLFKVCCYAMQEHYPERSFRMFVVNAPWWFKAAFAIVSPFIDPRTKQKIEVPKNPKEILAKLQEVISIDCIPECYGGQDKTPLGESMIEKQIRAHVLRVNKANDVPSFSVPAEVLATQPCKKK